MHGRELGLAVLLIGLVSGCAHGVGSKEFWRGTSSGSTGDCGPLHFDIVIADGRIEGYAASELPQGSVVWDVRGSVTPDNKVTLETVTPDPRIGQRRVTWSGLWRRLELTLAQTSPSTCQPPRTATLRRP